MSDSLMMIIGIFIAVILMFFFPLMEFAQKNDNIAQTTVQMATSDFINTVTANGEITFFDYNELVEKISATGNAFDIQIEAQIIDDNPRRATTTESSDNLGEYKYYSVYTNTIMDAIREREKYELKKDDYVTVTIKNTNNTLATQLKNLFYKFTGRDTYTIGTSASATVINGSETKVEEGAKLQPTENTPEKVVKLEPQTLISNTTTISGKANIIVILDCEYSTMPYHNNNSTSERFY